MTDDPHIKEAIRRLAEIDSANDWTMKDADNRIVKYFAEAIAADKWHPPVDPLVEAVADYLCRYFTPHSTFPWDIALVEKHASAIIKLVECAA